MDVSTDMVPEQLEGYEGFSYSNAQEYGGAVDTKGGGTIPSTKRYRVMAIMGGMKPRVMRSRKNPMRMVTGQHPRGKMTLMALTEIPQTGITLTTERTEEMMAAATHLQAMRGRLAMLTTMGVRLASLEAMAGGTHTGETAIRPMKTHRTLTHPQGEWICRCGYWCRR